MKQTGVGLAAAVLIDATLVRAVLWTINHPDVWHLPVAECGWSPKRYERWTADSACSQLLDRGARAS